MLDLKIKYLKKLKSNLILKTMEYTKMENEIINTESGKKYKNMLFLNSNHNLKN